MTAEARIKIVAESADASRQFDELARKLDGVQSSGDALSSTLEGMATKLVAFASIDRIVGALKEWTVEADKLQDATDLLGGSLSNAGQVMGLQLIPSLDVAISRARMLTAGLELTDQQLDAVALAAIQFAKANGTDAASAMSQLTAALISGNERGMRPFGLQLQEGATRAQNQAAALDQLTGAAERNRDAITSSLGTLDIYEGAWTRMKEKIGQAGLAMLELPLQTFTTALRRGAIPAVDSFVESVLRLHGSMNPGAINQATRAIWNYARAAAAVAGVSVTDLDAPGDDDNAMRRQALARSGGISITAEPSATDMVFSLEEAERAGEGRRRRGGGGGGGGRGGDPLADISRRAGAFTAEGLESTNAPGGTAGWEGGFTVPLGGSRTNREGARAGTNAGGRASERDLLRASRRSGGRDNTDFDAITTNAERTAESLSKMAEIGDMAFGALNSAVRTHVQAWIEGEESIGKALKGILSQTLQTMAIEAGVKAVMATAEGLFLLATSFGANPMAEVAFAAAAQYAAVAAIAGGGAALVGAIGGGGSRSSAGRGGAGRSSTRDLGADRSLGGQGFAGPSVTINIAPGGIIGPDAAEVVGRLAVDGVNRGIRLGGMPRFDSSAIRTSGSRA